MNNIKVIDPYAAYQILDDVWRFIQVDLEILQTEGDSALSAVDPYLVKKRKMTKRLRFKKDGKVMYFRLNLYKRCSCRMN